MSWAHSFGARKSHKALWRKVHTFKCISVSPDGQDGCDRVTNKGHQHSNWDEQVSFHRLFLTVAVIYDILLRTLKSYSER